MIAYLATLGIGQREGVPMAPRDRDRPLAELISLKEKRTIVTGGATGLGFAISRRFAEAGAAILIADSDATGAETAASSLTESGYRATGVRCDVSREEDVRSMTGRAVEELGGVDILVNSAGIYPRMMLEDMTADEFEKVNAVNLTGTFLCSREAALRMKEQGQGGCIINIGSINSLHPSAAGMTAYDASKGGVLMLTKSLARELGRHDIRVNIIAPGAIMTRAIASHMGETSREETKAQLKELKSFMSRMALGRMGDPDEIARVALFLASDMSSYMTGSLVVVDGGYLIS
jgi:2-deoxy-D-gluconate 3-dehydrogenase